MLTFRVRSNSGNWDYRIVVSEAEARAVITCDCKAARHGSFCKHRVRLIRGDPSMIQSKNRAEVARVAELFKGSHAIMLIERIASIENAMEALQKNLTEAKHALSAELWFEPE